MRGDQDDGPLVCAVADGGEVILGEAGVAAIGARVEVHNAQLVLVLEANFAAKRGLANTRVSGDDEAAVPLVVGGLDRLEVDDACAGSPGPLGAEAESGCACELRRRRIGSIDVGRGRATGESLRSVETLAL